MERSRAASKWAEYKESSKKDSTGLEEEGTGRLGNDGEVSRGMVDAVRAN